MKKIYFIIFLVGLTTLMLISNTRKLETGTIKEIYSSNSKTTIQLETSENKLIIFQKISDLQKGDKIKFIGDEEIYKNETQIIVDKLYLVK